MDEKLIFTNETPCHSIHASNHKNFHIKHIEFYKGRTFAKHLSLKTDGETLIHFNNYFPLDEDVCCIGFGQTGKVFETKKGSDITLCLTGCEGKEFMVEITMGL